MEQFSGQGPDRAGDLAALLPELTRAARRMARAGVEPDDLVQETALMLWRRLEDSAKPDVDNPRAYAHAILRKAAFKARSMREEMIAEDTPEASCAPIGETRLIFAVKSLKRNQGGKVRGEGTHCLNKKPEWLKRSADSVRNVIGKLSVSSSARMSHCCLVTSARMNGDDDQARTSLTRNVTQDGKDCQ